MSPLEANLAALAPRFPLLAARIGSSDPNPAFAAFPSRSGALSASLGGAALHSRYDPSAEAAKTAASLREETDICVLFGFGLGYLAEACLAAKPDLLVLVMERDPSLLRSALEARDMSSLLSSDRLSIALGASPEGLVQALDELRVSKPFRLANPACLQADPGYWAACDEALRRWESKRGINDATLRKFGSLWVRNLGKNLPWIGEAPGIASLAGSFAGIPALVVAAGPSLDELLPDMAEYARTCLIVAVDTSARLVQEAGIDPDFVIVADPQYWNSRHLDRFDPRRSILVAESAVHPRIFSLPWKAVFLSASIFPLARFVESRTGEKGSLGAGGSVATTAWDFARHLGCSPLYMAGLDLGFPGLATHASGSFFEERALRGAFRLSPAETSSFNAAHSAKPFLAADASGGRILTDKRMILYAWWFESRVAKAPESPTYSLSSRGLAIPGLAPVALKAPLAGESRRADIEGRMEKVLSLPPPSREAWSAAKEDLLADLSLISRSAASALEASSMALWKVKRGDSPGKELSALEKADAALLSSQARDIVSFLFPAIGSLFGKDPENLEGALENGRKVYAEIRKQAEFHLSVLEGRRRATDSADALRA